MPPQPIRAMLSRSLAPGLPGWAKAEEEIRYGTASPAAPAVRRNSRRGRSVEFMAGLLEEGNVWVVTSFRIASAASGLS